MKKLLLSLIAISLLGIAFFILNEKEKKEKALFENMWRALFNEDTFAYTLVGSKPVSSTQWEKKLYDPATPYFRFETLFLNEARQLWEKFSVKNPSDFYSLIFLDKKKDDYSFTELILINKKEVKKTIEQNKNVFINYSKNCSIEEFVLDIFNRHDDLQLGLLLGFGIENSKIFKKKSEVFNFYKTSAFFPNALSLNDEELNEFNYCPELSSSNNELTTQEFLNELKNLFEDRTFSSNFDPHENPLTSVSLPPFAIFSGSEDSLNLIKNYQLERKKIVKLKQSENFFEEVMQIYFKGNHNE